MYVPSTYKITDTRAGEEKGEESGMYYPMPHYANMPVCQYARLTRTVRMYMIQYQTFILGHEFNQAHIPDRHFPSSIIVTRDRRQLAVIRFDLQSVRTPTDRKRKRYR